MCIVPKKVYSAFSKSESQFEARTLPILLLVKHVCKRIQNHRSSAFIYRLQCVVHVNWNIHLERFKSDENVTFAEDAPGMHRVRDIDVLRNCVNLQCDSEAQTTQVHDWRAPHYSFLEPYIRWYWRRSLQGW